MGDTGLERKSLNTGYNSNLRKGGRSQRNGITQDDILREIARLAFSDMTDYKIDADGQVQLPDLDTRRE